MISSPLYGSNDSVQCAVPSRLNQLFQFMIMLLKYFEVVLSEKLLHKFYLHYDHLFLNGVGISGNEIR